MPDPDRPSSAPLSEADADRLSERFTASWDDPEPAGTPVAEPLPPPAPLAPPAVAQPPAGVGPSAAAPARPAWGLTTPLKAAPAAAPSPGTQAPAPAAAARGPTPATVPRAKPKATLLGIAPIVVVGPSQPPPAAPAAAAAKPSATPPAAPLSTPPPESSSSPTATAVTTPSKPYIPKDHPLTPAVVISGEALAESAPPREDRARIAQTIPGQTRSNPSSGVAAPFPLAASSSVLDDTYPPLKRRGSKLPLLFAGALLLAAGGFAFIKLTGSRSSERSEDAPAARQPDPAPPAETPSPVPAAEAPPPVLPSEPVASAGPKNEAVPAPEPAADPEPPPPTKRTKTRKVTAAPVRRPAARPEPKTEVKTTAPAPEPAAAPTAKPAKGVIVRETPF